MKQFVYFLLFAFFFHTTYAGELPTVAIVTTGGTIAEKVDPKTGGAVPALTGEELIKAVPELSAVANIKVINFSNIDSSQMTPELWLKLSEAVDKTLEDSEVVGVVVTHGTDTMAEGAFFLNLTLSSKKPVTFVGAMRNASDPSPDGPANILNGVKLVASEQAKNWGVTVTLNQFINSARDVRKTNTTNVQTFNSGNHGYLGYIAGNRVLSYNGKRDVPKFSRPDNLVKVSLIKTYAGDDGELIRYVVDHGTQGIVVEGVGAGNVNKDVNKAIDYAISKKIPVVISTRVPHGGVFPIYADKGGGETLQKEGVILGGDFISSKARLLLMLALSNDESDLKKLQSYFTY